VCHIKFKHNKGYLYFFVECNIVVEKLVKTINLRWLSLVIVTVRLNIRSVNTIISNIKININLT